MATKTQSRKSTTARRSAGTAAHTRTRMRISARSTAKTAKAKRKAVFACILGVLATLAVIAGTVLLILEFCTAYKPSNGFKKAVPETEQTETLPDDKGGEKLPAGGEETKPDQGGETDPAGNENGGEETPDTPDESGQEETV